MKIVAVTRVLNEDDIIESFLRHHAPMVDHHIVLDNGSMDHTVPIIRQLHAEGLRLSLCSNPAAVFQEMYHNTALYGMASRAFDADWVVYLDCDEFIDLRGGSDLRSLLAGVPSAMPAILLDMINYRPSSDDDATELSIPRRIQHRVPQLSNVWKSFLRGNLPGELMVLSGNHGAVLDGHLLPAAQTETARLAHFSTRSPWQELAKLVIGRLKVLGGGRETMLQNFAAHYIEPYELLLHRPAEFLVHSDRMQLRTPVAAGLVHDPLPTASMTTRYTHSTDYKIKAVQSLLAVAERLARHHGELLDAAREAGVVADELKISRVL